MADRQTIRIGGPHFEDLERGQLFDDAPALTVTAGHAALHQAICGDRLLAGWDRSVAQAFDQGGGDRDEQRAWLLERDRCGADSACLQETMSIRTGSLLR